MKLSRCGFIFIVLFLIPYTLHAGDLAIQEAFTYYNEAVKAQRSHNFVLADVSFQKALLLDPYNPRWHKAYLNNKGIVFTQHGDFDNAEEAFLSAIEIDQTYKQARLNLGLLYEMTKDKDFCIKYWYKAFNLEKYKPKDFVIEPRLVEQGEEQ